MAEIYDLKQLKGQFYTVLRLKYSVMLVKIGLKINRTCHLIVTGWIVMDWLDCHATVLQLNATVVCVSSVANMPYT